MKSQNPYQTEGELKKETKIYKTTFITDSNIPPAYSNPPMVQAPPNVIVIQQPVIYRAPNLSHCPFCNVETDTYEVYHDGTFVWLMCLLLWIFTCFFFWVAFCCEGWKDLEFRCARCNRIKWVRKGGC